MLFSISSLNFKAGELKFCIQTSHINAKKIATRFLNFCFGAGIWSKNCKNFINESQLWSSFSNRSHNIKARELIFCMKHNIALANT